MKTKVLWGNYILLVLLLVSTICYDVFKLFPMKCMTSTIFVVLGILNFIYVKKSNNSKTKIALLMLVGIILAMGGDVSIQFDFIIGAAVFAMGHVFYLITYCVIDKIRKSDLILSLCIFVAITAFLFLTPIFDFGDATMKVVVMVYCMIISSMTAKSVMNRVRNHTKSNFFFALGSVMFFFSDVMLVLNLFANTSDLTFVLCHSVYFPGQWVLAHAMYHLAEE